MNSAAHQRRKADDRRRAIGREDGFSLIELFVVCLIIGVLCAIAIPLFLSQSEKATDASAKELARTAETTAETIATQNGGSYENITPTELHSVEPTIPLKAEGANQAFLLSATHGPDEYSVTTKASNGDEITISRNADGTITRTCKSDKGNCSEGENGSW